MVIMSAFSKTRFRSLIVAGAATLASFTVPATAQSPSVESFYKGKTITLVVGFTPGGGYDLNARAVARFMGDHIPGKPKVVIQNMPGAGGLTAANWLAQIAPRDGSAIADIQPSIVLNKALDPAARYDPSEFFWIGRLRERVVAFLTAQAAAYEELIAAAPEQWWSAFFPIWKDLEAGA